MIVVVLNWPLLFGHVSFVAKFAVGTLFFVKCHACHSARPCSFVPTLDLFKSNLSPGSTGQKGKEQELAKSL